jgi:hypothetical protein
MPSLGGGGAVGAETGRERGALRAYLELVYGRMNLAEYVRAIREVGAEHFILSTDLGQANNPLHPDGLVAYFAALKKGFRTRILLACRRRIRLARWGCRDDPNPSAP